MTIEALEPSVIPKKKESIQSLMDRYLNSAGFSKYGPTTQITYTTALSSLQEYCKDNEISDANALTESNDVINSWKENLERKGLSKNGIRSKKTAVSSFRKWSENDISVQIDLKNGIILTNEQIINLISSKSLDNLRDASLILIALKTGAKLSEILNLKKDDIIRSEDNGFMIQFNSGKNSGFRDVPIDQKTFGLLALYTDTLDVRQQRLYITDRRRTSESEAERILIEVGNAIGIDGLNYQSLRNTFIHNFKGSDPDLRERLGVN